MADASGKQRPPKIISMVKNDELWKAHVETENLSARKRWPEMWGFLVQEYRKLDDLLEGHPTSSNDVETPKSWVNNTKLPLIPPRQKQFPVTTTQEIGWKSTQNSKTFDIAWQFGERRRGKGSLVKRLQWPHDSIP